MVFIIGLLAGRAVMSIGMMLLIGNALINLNIKETFRSFYKDRSSVLLVGIFMLYAITYFWSANTSYYSSRLQLMLPFLALPIVMHSIRWERKWFDYLAMLFIGVCVLGVSWSIYQYAIDRDAINAAYGVSKSIPTPFMNDHIRFGVAVVVGVSFCFQFLKEKMFQWLFGFLAFALIAYLHILASKTALLALYLIIFYEVVVLILKKKKVIWGLGALAILVLLPVLFFYTSETFRNKMYYTQYAFYEMFNDNTQANVSDEGRVVSYKTALGIVKNNLLLGVGIGDGLDEMNKSYAQQDIDVNGKTLFPHNQFLYVALISGLLGLLIFLFACTGIVLQNFQQSSWLASFLLIFLVPFMVEAFFNTQYGVAIFIFFFLLLRRKEICNPIF